MGGHEPSALHEADEELWDATMRINSKSVFLGCKYALAQMLQQDPHPSGDRGWIVNISSIASLVAIENIGPYSASKGAVSSLTRQAALDYGPHRIHINAICPGCMSPSSSCPVASLTKQLSELPSCSRQLRTRPRRRNTIDGTRLAVLERLSILLRWLLCWRAMMRAGRLVLSCRWTEDILCGSILSTSIVHMIVSSFIKLLLGINGWPIPQQFQQRQKQSWPIAALALVLNILPRRPAPPFAFFRLDELLN